MSLMSLRDFFFWRLMKIREETTIQPMPRRRSNSLPIPKIEISRYLSTESTKKKEEAKEYVDQVPEQREALIGILFNNNFLKKKF